MKQKKNKQNTPKNRQTKSILVFDEKARVDFLTGFSKRKKARQKKAQEEISTKIKEERRLFKQKKKEFTSNSTKKYQTAPVELENLTNSEVTELEDHTVTITDVSDLDLAGQGDLRLGLNKFTEEDNLESSVDTQESEEPQVSHHQQQKILRRIEERITKRQKHVQKQPQKKKVKRVLSKKKKHLKKHGYKRQGEKQ